MVPVSDQDLNPVLHVIELGDIDLRGFCVTQLPIVVHRRAKWTTGVPVSG
jgi:hypothetical protein